MYVATKLIFSSIGEFYHQTIHMIIMRKEMVFVFTNFTDHMITIKIYVIYLRITTLIT